MPDGRTDGRRGGRKSRHATQNYSTNPAPQTRNSIAEDRKQSNVNAALNGTKIIACGMIGREILALKQQLSLENLELTCLPASYHHYPDKIAPALDLEIQRARDDGWKNIFVGYADCGSGGDIDKVCERHAVARLDGPHCFSFYIGNDKFAARKDEHMRDFFMTDFLARHFKTFMLEPLGIDRHPELIEIYFQHYSRLVYLAQTLDPVLVENARNAADFLGLEYVYEYTGYGDLGAALQDLPIDDQTI